MRTTLTLKQVVDEWIENTDSQQITRDDYRRKINLWFRWLSANAVDPREPTRKYVLEYKRKLNDEGKSVFTVCAYITVVKLFYRYCEEARYYDNIGAGIKSAVKQKYHYKKALTESQAIKLVESIDTEKIIDLRDKFIISLMLYNGFRCVEIERMNIGDIFPQGRSNLVARLQRKGRFDKNEFLSIPSKTYALYCEYIHLRKAKSGEPLIVSHSNHNHNKRLSRTSISVQVKHRLKNIGIDEKDITAHSLRHTCASLMVENGVELETIKELLGHSDVKTTRIYADTARQKRLIDHSPSDMIASKISKKKRK